MKLAKKVCLIAGASSGMGRQTALTAAAQGATVIVAARRVNLCESIVAEIEKDGGRAMAVQLDGRDPASVEELIGSIDKEFGQLDCVFNNLGHLYGHSAFHETPFERWRDTLDTNLSAVFYLLRAELPLLLRSGGGAIVNNSSTAGLIGMRSMADYSAAKWGLIGLTRTVALEYAAQNVRCNVIAPGLIATEKFAELQAANPDLFTQLRADIPSQQFGDMQNIADTVTWLLSDEARYINGATIPVDAGRTA